MEDKRIRVLIVDDSIVARMVLQEMIREDPALMVAGSEASGQEALDHLDVTKPDVVILDVEMPGMSGIEVVTELRKRSLRLPIIMFSSLTLDGAAVTIEALTRGASDFVTKPSLTVNADSAKTQARDQLLPKIKALAGRRIPLSPLSPVIHSPSVTLKLEKRPVIDLVCIATSTGGPEALEVVFRQLPADLPVPIVIVQHMPPYFTKQLASRLDEKCPPTVREAESGNLLQPGTALIAPGNFHMVVRRRPGRSFVMMNTDPPENSCRPAADVLFRSAAEEFGSQVLGVVLTGMGQDGLKGSEAIKKAGGRIIVQDEATSVIWGMPGTVFRAGLASNALPLDKIAGDIVRRVWEGRA